MTNKTETTPFELDVVFGSISFSHKGGPHGSWLYKDEYGNVTKTVPLEHIVCCGTDFCSVCGRPMS